MDYNIEEQERKLQELKEQRNNLWKERADIDEKIADVDRMQYELFEEITKEKSKSSESYKGQFIQFNDIYMLVKKISNEYNGCVAAFTGPYFQLYDDIFCNKKRGTVLHMNSGDGDIDYYPPVKVKNIEDVRIITKQEFMEAYERYFNKSYAILAEAIEKTAVDEDPELTVDEDPELEVIS